MTKSRNNFTVFGSVIGDLLRICEEIDDGMDQVIKK
jgi:hypothetical protein